MLVDDCSKNIATPTNPLSTILDKTTEINKIQVNKTNLRENVSSTSLPTTVVSAPQLSRIVNVVPNGNFVFATNSIQLMPLTVPVNLVQFQGGMGHPRQPLAMKTIPVVSPASYALQTYHPTKQTPVYVKSKISAKPVTDHSENIKKVPIFSVKSAVKPGTGHLENSLGAIKVVDVNKLLQPPINGREESTPQNFNNLQEHTTERTPKSSSSEVIKSALCEELLNDSSDVKVSHVLKCLKIILPDNFDLSRLIPNEKVSRLIIRYLKISDCVTTQTVVKSSLEIIVRASKSEIKMFGDFNRHPYLKIKPLALQVALAQLLPSSYSMIDVTDNLLNCLCIILNQDIYTDGFPILRGKMFNFSRDYIEYEKIASQNEWRNKNNADLKNDVFIEEDSCDSVSNVQDYKYTKDIEIIKEISHPPKKSDNAGGSKRYRKVSVKRKSYYVGTSDDDTKDPSYCPESDCEPSNLQPYASPKIKTDRLNMRRGAKDFDDGSLDSNYFMRSILNYLNIKQCTAQDVLVSFKLMFNLCRHLNLKSKHSNLVKLKEILRSLAGKNISHNDVGHFGKNKKKRKRLKQSVDKLSMNPVVVLTDLVDHSKDVISFLSTSKKNQEFVKPKILNHCRSSNNSVSQSFEQCPLSQTHSSEYVRKLTDESYKVFRKIIMKKDNGKVVFRLKYKDLCSGTKVFVKDFLRRSFGYVEGTIIKRNGPISYLVQLENGEKRKCFVDHLRPVLGLLYSTRTHRLIKPKQLFDL